MSMSTIVNKTLPFAATPSSAPPSDPHDAGVKSKWRSTYIATAIAALVGIAIALFMPAVGGLTPEGVNALAVVVPVTILWLTVGTGWPSIVALGLLVVAGAFTPGGVWAASLGNATVAMILVFTFVAQALADAGVVDAITNWMLTRKILRGRPRLFLLTMMFTHIFLGMMMSTIPLGIIYIGMLDKLLSKLGVKKGSRLGTMAMQGTLWAHSIANVASPIAGTWPLVVIGLMAGHGINITFGMWFAFGIPFAVLAGLVSYVATIAGKPDLTPLRDLDMEEFAANAPKISKQGKFAAITATIMAFVLLLPDFLNLLNIGAPIADFLSRVGITIPAIAAIAVMCLVRVEGKPVMDYTKSLKGTPIGIIVFLASLFAISSVIGNDEFGITTWLHGLLEPVLYGLSPFWVLAIVAGLSLILTNFMSSAVVFWLSWSVSLAVLAGTSIPIAPFAVVVMIASMQAVLTQPSTTLAAVAYETGRITVKDALKANLVFLLGIFVILMTVVYPMVSAILPGGAYLPS